MLAKLVAAAIGALFFAIPASAAGTDPALAAAVAGAQRNPDHVVRDTYRHPAESLAFWGLKGGMTVVEISPSTGYWTDILAPYLKATGGHYIGAVGGEDRKHPEKFDNKAVYGDVQYTVFNKDKAELPNGTADLVLTARNIHNWMWVSGYAERAFADFHKALKPGGILAVEEHRADPRPMVAEARDGYVATAHVIALAEKAGFKLEAQSEINANPRDTKDHPFGVWTLPPTRRSAPQGQPADPNFDHTKYDAIGESDRMTLRFRKPGA